jgi:hypothetical protein
MKYFELSQEDIVKSRKIAGKPINAHFVRGDSADGDVVSGETKEPDGDVSDPE